MRCWLAAWLVVLGAAVPGVGCAGSASAPAIPRAEPSPAEVDAAMSHPRPAGEGASSRTLQEPAAPLAGAVRIREPSPPSPRRSGRRVDVELHRASLADALQLLADEARLNLVLGDGIGGEVSLSLRRVDPLEALRAVVASRGLSLSQQGSITVVQRR